MLIVYLIYLGLLYILVTYYLQVDNINREDSMWDELRLEEDEARLATYVALLKAGWYN